MLEPNSQVLYFGMSEGVELLICTSILSSFEGMRLFTPLMFYTVVLKMCFYGIYHLGRTGKILPNSICQVGRGVDLFLRETDFGPLALYTKTTSKINARRPGKFVSN